MMRTVVRTRKGERGSALLIVFLFAAVLAISLYIEMPSVAFEAKRAKEQLLIDRGDEYAHAVKLYYRKFRTYPPSLDALENTNQMRFLRHRFKDPMTGDGKWRLLHAGPGGQLTDSLVNPIGLNANGKTPGTGTNSSFGSNSTNASNTGSNAAVSNASNSPWGAAAASSDNGSGTTVAGIPQRPPEMPIGGGAAINPASNIDPTESLLPTTAAQTQPAQSGAVTPGTAPTFQMGIPAQAMPQTSAASGSNMSNPMQGVQGLFANPNPLPGTGNPAITAPLTSASPGGTTNSAFPTTGTPSGMGTMQAGGIAGVASLAKGATIKTVNEETDYSLWEFYYDPTKDTSMVGQSGINPMNGVTQPNTSAPGASTSNGSTSNTSTPTNPTTTPLPFTAAPPAPINPPQQP